jgi:SAM-dependent methyltransferase
MTEISMDESYDDFERIEEAFGLRLDESLDPRGPDSLYEIVATLDVPAGELGIDIGCGGGEDSITIAQRFGLRMHGIDPVAHHVSESAASAEAAGLADRVRFSVGVAEHLPVDDASAAFVWAKECLMYADLDKAFAEMARVLRPGGVGLVYQVMTGPLMTDEEGAAYWGGDLGVPANSVRPEDIEAAIAGAGLELTERIDFGSEWGEHGQEQTGKAGRRLLHAARLLRQPDRYIAEYGEANYRVMLGDCLWHVHRMIGKLHGAAFTFRRP